MAIWTQQNDAVSGDLVFLANGIETFRIREDGTIVSDNDREVYTQSNIVGTVADTGGLPSGAIIESGSNANGSYVKFADGTMIAHREYVLNENISNTSGALFFSVTQLGTPLPVSFAALPTFIASTDCAVPSWPVHRTSGSATHWPQIQAAADSNRTAQNVRYMRYAIGRWKV